MKSLNDLLLEVVNVFQDIDCDVFHYTHPIDSKAPFIVWAEDGPADQLEFDNKVGERSIHGTIDYFTLEELDPRVTVIENALNDNPNINMSLKSIQFEPSTNLIHIEWDFVVS